MSKTKQGSAERVRRSDAQGASGAAIECMNIAIGAERTKGLVL